MKDKIELKFTSTMFFIFEDYSNTQIIRLKDDVNVEALKKAVEKTIKVFPLVTYKLTTEGVKFFIEKTSDEFKLFPALDEETPATLCTKEDGYRIFGVSYSKNKIFVSYFHAISDGTGRNRFSDTLMYYYFSIKNIKEYNSSDIWLDEGTPKEGQDVDLFDCDLTPSPDYVYQSGLNSDDGFFLPESEELLNGAERKTTRYNITLDKTKFMEYAKANGMSPSIVYEYMMAKTLQKLFPENKKHYSCVIAANLRPYLNQENTFLECSHQITQSITPESLLKPENEIGTELRSQLKSWMNGDRFKTELLPIYQKLSKLSQLSSMDQIRAIYANRKITPIATTVFSYIGRIQQTEYMNEIDSIDWTSNSSLSPMFTMVDVNGTFVISVIQAFETPKYFDALANEFESHGIPVLRKEKLSAGGRAKVEFKKYFGWE